MNKNDTISGIDLLNMLSENFQEYISSDKDYVIKSISAGDLLNKNRIDVVAKYIYAKAYIEHNLSKYESDLYLEHIKSFNHFVEADGSNKIGKDIFVESFNSLILSIQENGFDFEKPIPVTVDGVILDGAHRVAICLALDIKLNVIILELSSPKFDCDFFKNRGLNDSYIDHLSLEYARLKVSTRVVVLWPNAKGNHKKVLHVISEYGELVNNKEILLTTNGKLALTRLCYSKEPWLGTYEDGFVGAQSKSNQCCGVESIIKIFLIDFDTDLIRMKDDIRAIFNIGKHSVHINDTHEETIELVESLFNRNSISFLNMQVPRFFKNFEHLKTIFNEYLLANDLSKDSFLLDGSACLAAVGARDVNDLDVLSCNSTLPFIREGIDVSNSKEKFHLHKPIELIFNPDCYFYFNGFKFTSLDILYDFKLRRNSANDKGDLEIIKCLRESKSIKIPFSVKVKKYYNVRFWLGSLKLLALKLRYLYQKKIVS